MLKEKKGKIFVLILVFSLLAVFTVMANDKPGLFGILDMEPDELDDFDFTPLPSCEEGETLIFSDDEWDCIETDGFSGAGCYFNEEEYIKLLAAYYDETGGDMTTVEELQNYFEDATYDPVHHFLDYFTHDYETDYNDKKPREVIEVAIENDIINDFPFRCDGSAIENGGVVPQNGADSLSGCHFNEEEYLERLAEYYTDEGTEWPNQGPKEGEWGPEWTSEDMKSAFLHADYTPIEHFVAHCANNEPCRDNVIRPEAITEDDELSTPLFDCDGFSNNGVFASDSNAVAIGLNAEATHLSSTALGHDAKAFHNYTIAIGRHAEATGSRSTAIGNNAEVSGMFGSVALGFNADAAGNSATALGRNADAAGDSATALGRDAKTTSNNQIMLGTNIDDVVIPGTLVESSDIRYKENVETITNAREKLLKIDGIRYTPVNQSDKTNLGLSAQNVNEVFPEVVNIDDNGDFSVQYSRIISPIIETIKEQEQDIKELRAENEELRDRLNEIEKMFENQ